MFVVGLRLLIPKSFRICLFTCSRDHPSSPNCDLSWLLTFRSREIGLKWAIMENDVLVCNTNSKF